MTVTIFDESKLDSMWSDHLANGALSSTDLQYLADKADDVATDTSDTEKFLEYIIKEKGFDYSYSSDDVLHAIELIVRYYNSAVDVQNSYGQTALHVATNRGEHDAMDLLLAATAGATWTAADNNIQDDWGDTAGHFAAVVDDATAAQKLVDSDTAFLDTENDWWETPHDTAIWMGSTSVEDVYYAAM